MGYGSVALMGGDKRNRTYSAKKQQIYSLPQLSNFGVSPYVLRKERDLNPQTDCSIYTLAGCCITILPSFQFVAQGGLEPPTFGI